MEATQYSISVALSLNMLKLLVLGILPFLKLFFNGSSVCLVVLPVERYPLKVLKTMLLCPASVRSVAL